MALLKGCPHCQQGTHRDPQSGSYQRQFRCLHTDPGPLGSFWGSSDLSAQDCFQAAQQDGILTS